MINVLGSLFFILGLVLIYTTIRLIDVEIACAIYITLCVLSIYLFAFSFYMLKHKSSYTSIMTNFNREHIMKKMKKFIFVFMIILLCLILFSCKRKVDDTLDESIYDIGMSEDFAKGKGLVDGNGEKISVLFLIGQSNCTGCSITSYLKDQVEADDFNRYQNGYKNVLINYNLDNGRSTSNGSFVNVDLSCGSTSLQFGPEVGLADELSKANLNKKVFILKYSMSGYSLNWHWLRHEQRGEIYNNFKIYASLYLDYLKSMNYDISLDAILWMQGESDTATSNSLRYYNNELALISYLREDFKNYTKQKEIYFIDAGISDCPYCLPGYPIVNKSKEVIATLSKFNLYFPTIENGLTTMHEPYYDPDLGHYDALSMLKLGQLYAKEVLFIYGE